MKYIGIDIGAKGGLTCLFKEEVFILDYDLTMYIDFLKILEPKECKILIESVHSMPSQGVSSMFSFGTRAGEIIGILETLGFEYEYITPQKWIKLLSVVPKSGKEGTYDRLKVLYPEPVINMLRTKRGRLLDGRSDSLAIATVCKIKEHK